MSDFAVSRRGFLTAVGVGAAGLAVSGRYGAVADAADAPPVGIPFLHGYDGPAILSWTPQSDPYAKFFRSRVPLANRISPFAPTQANPTLDHRPRLMSLANDYMEAENAVLAHKYGYSFTAYALRFWQYLDMMGSWHGLPVYGDYGKDNPRYGVINLPNPAWTDAAHRNGVRSLGCWFWPRPEEFDVLISQAADGSFPLADKLVEMATYFGFDGYFINQEAEITPDQATKLRAMFEYLHRIAPPGFHVQWYDSLTVDGKVDYENEFDAVNAPWVGDAQHRVNSSIFLNYWWSAEKMQRSNAYATQLGLDPYDVVFSGTEAGQNNFSQPYDPRWIFPEGGPPLTSWATLGAEMVWSIVPGAKDTVDAQRPVYTYERQYYSGPRQDPSDTGRTLPPTGKDKHNPQRWDGVAHYIAERSVIGAYPFVTRFNTGTGERFFIDGTLSAETGWYNIGIQDVLPTWQWWVRNSTGISVDYDYSQALDGGTSLIVSGAAAEQAELRLFKTDLAVTPEVTFGLTFRSTHAGVLVGLTFADSPDSVEWLDNGRGRPGVGGWSRRSWDLGRFAGRTIAALSLGFQAARDFTVRVGELRLDREGLRPPSAPRRFAVDQIAVAGDVATVFCSWEFAPHGVWYYDLFRTGAGGRRWIGRIFDETYCVPGLSRQDTMTFELVAVGLDGKRSAPVRATVRWP